MESEKLEKNLGGIKEMKEIPGVIFVVDPKKERIAILEARKLNIPVVGLVDTNCNPEDVDYCIPGNDDAIRAVKLIADAMADAGKAATCTQSGLSDGKKCSTCNMFTVEQQTIPPNGRFIELVFLPLFFTLFSSFLSSVHNFLAKFSII